MCAVGAGLEFRMELYADVKRVAGELHGFYQPVIRRGAGEDHTMLAKRVAVAVVKLIAVTVPFLHFAAAVGLFQEGARVDFTGISTQAHGTAFGKIALLVRHQIDDRVRPIGFEFAGVCFEKAQHVACKFNYCDLDAQADSQIGDVVLPGIFGGDNFALNAPLAESAGNQNTVTVETDIPRRFRR